MPEQSYLVSWIGPIIGVVIGFALTSIKEWLYYSRERRKSKLNRRIEILVECLKLHERSKTIRVREQEDVLLSKIDYEQVLGSLSGLKPWLLMLELHAEGEQPPRIRAVYDRIDLFLQAAYNWPVGYSGIPGRQLLELRDEMQTVLMDACQATFNEYETAGVTWTGQETCANLCAGISFLIERMKRSLR
jgi:hypothetical protein